MKIPGKRHKQTICDGWAVPTWQTTRNKIAFCQRCWVHRRNSAYRSNAEDISYLMTKSPYYNISYTGKSFALSRSLLGLVQLAEILLVLLNSTKTTIFCFLYILIFQYSAKFCIQTASLPYTINYKKAQVCKSWLVDIEDSWHLGKHSRSLGYWCTKAILHLCFEKKNAAWIIARGNMKPGEW